MNKDCGCHSSSSPYALCGCCAGTEKLTPLPTANRPGLPALAYRIGTHATFLETMRARLSSLCLGSEEECREGKGSYPLGKLTTREADDPALALLDGWATVADVLTFYQERIANEGYLRTATERRSILELARLVGYTLRPGVAASVYLAYTLERDSAVTIPAGSLAQSVPGPGEMQQPFETAEPLHTRTAWNHLQVRITQPQTKHTITNPPNADGPRVYLKGILTNLSPNDALLIDFGDRNPELFRVLAVTPDAAADRTLVKLRPWAVGMVSGVAAVREIAVRFSQAGNFGVARGDTANRVIGQLQALIQHLDSAAPEAVKIDSLKQQTLPRLTSELAELSPQATQLKPWLSAMVDELSTALRSIETARISTPQTITRDRLLSSETLLKQTSLQPANASRLPRNLAEINPESDIALQLITTFRPEVRTLLPPALANAAVTSDNPIRVYALRVKASLFGHNAPKRQRVLRDGEEDGAIEIIGEWPIVDQRVPPPFSEEENAIYLDTSYDQILSGSWVVIDARNVPLEEAEHPVQIRPAERPYIIAQAKTVESQIARAEYGISGKTTRIELTRAWIGISPMEIQDRRQRQQMWDRDFQVIRRTAIYAQSEELELAEEPIEQPICGTDGEIELDGLYDGLQAGRWLIVSGERTDIPATSGVKAAELVMLAEVRHDVQKSNEGTTDLPGDKLHTFIKLANDIAYCYKRDTIKIYGNVVKATHGETRREVLGSGDGSKTLQQFTLQQPPLTYVPAPNPSGVESTLQVFVNDVQWHEADMPAGLGPTDRHFLTRTDDEGKTTILSGNGREGARLPTGMENVRAVYRNGIGKAGNVKAEQISMLGDRPLGVKEVLNPLPASGGADKEGRDQARQNAPLAVMALDRLVSTQDYADFARTFAGISKASAVRLPDGRQQLVHLTVAGVDDIPIDEHSDLYRNLRAALRRCGDPYQPFHIARRELILLVIRANVRVQPDIPWESVKLEMCKVLLKTFSFECCELGQDARLSKAISVIQRLKGVEYVDVDVFGGVPEKKVQNNKREFLTPTEIASEIQKMAAESQVQGPAHRVRVPLASMEGGQLRPAHIAYLVPATLILNEVSR